MPSRAVKARPERGAGVDRRLHDYGSRRNTATTRPRSENAWSFERMIGSIVGCSGCSRTVPGTSPRPRPSRSTLFYHARSRPSGPATRCGVTPVDALCGRCRLWCVRASHPSGSSASSDPATSKSGCPGHRPQRRRCSRGDAEAACTRRGCFTTSGWGGHCRCCR